MISMKDKVRVISDMAFDAIDIDRSGQLDRDELGQTLKSVSTEMGISQPTEADIAMLLDKIDQDEDNEISKDEFEFLIISVL